MAGLRGDEVAPEILGMNKLLSDESLRHALAHLASHPPVPPAVDWTLICSSCDLPDGIRLPDVKG